MHPLGTVAGDSGLRTCALALVAQPSSLTQKQIDNLTAYVRQGGPVLLFLDPLPYENPQIEVLALVEGSGDMNDGSATITVPAVTQIMQAYFNITPPNPLPKGCQMDLPALPPRIDPNAPPKTYIRSGPGR